jgi:hypothetical protein
VTTQLLEVKEVLPGLDKVLYRALSLNPRHRYQRAFVLREDLRGLMAGFSFANIDQDTQDFLKPLFAARGEQRTDEVMPLMSGDDTQPETTASLLGSDAPRAEDGLTTTSIEVQAQTPSVPPPGLPVAYGTPQGPASQDTASFLRAARDSAQGGETRPENPISSPPRANLGQAAPPPAPPRPDFSDDDDVPTDVRIAPDETSWVAKLQPPNPGRDPLDPPTRPPEEPQVSAEPPPADPSPAPLAPVNTLPQADFHPPQNLASTEVAEAQVGTEVDDFDDLDWRPRKRSIVPFVVMGGVAVSAMLVTAFVCFGSTSGALWLQGREPVAASEEPATVAASAPAEDETQEALPAEPDPEIAAAGAGDDAKGAIRAPAPRLASSGSRASSAASETADPSPRTRLASPDRVRREPLPEPSGYVEEPILADDYADTEEEVVPIVAQVPGDESGYAERSFQGELTAADREVLGDVSTADPDYTRSLSLLYQDARARGDLAGRRTYLAAIMALPENEYRPEFLVEEAELAIRGRQYTVALEKATLAERHWQRLPSDLIFTRKAMIFEIAASAYTGLFYDSDGQQMDALDNAIRGWEKYRRHVDAKSRDDLSARADRQLDKLYGMQRRLE